MNLLFDIMEAFGRRLKESEISNHFPGLEYAASINDVLDGDSALRSAPRLVAIPAEVTETSASANHGALASLPIDLVMIGSRNSAAVSKDTSSLEHLDWLWRVQTVLRQEDGQLLDGDGAPLTQGLLDIGTVTDQVSFTTSPDRWVMVIRCNYASCTYNMKTRELQQ